MAAGRKGYEGEESKKGCSRMVGGHRIKAKGYASCSMHRGGRSTHRGVVTSQIASLTMHAEGGMPGEGAQGNGLPKRKERENS